MSALDVLSPAARGSVPQKATSAPRSSGPKLRDNRRATVIG